MLLEILRVIVLQRGGVGDEAVRLIVRAQMAERF